MRFRQAASDATVVRGVVCLAGCLQRHGGELDGIEDVAQVQRCDGRNGLVVSHPDATPLWTCRQG